MRRPEQHRLLFQDCARLAILEDAFDDATGLIGFIPHREELWLCAGRPLGPEIFGEAFLCQIDHAVRCGEDRLR